MQSRIFVFIHLSCLYVLQLAVPQRVASGEGRATAVQLLPLKSCLKAKRLFSIALQVLLPNCRKSHRKVDHVSFIYTVLHKPVIEMTGDSNAEFPIDVSAWLVAVFNRRKRGEN